MIGPSNLRWLLVLAVAAGGVPGCGGGDDTPVPAPAPAPSPAPAPAPVALLNNPDPASGCAAVVPLASALSATGMQVAITSSTLRTTATADAVGQLPAVLRGRRHHQRRSRRHQDGRPDRCADDLRDRLPDQSAEHLERQAVLQRRRRHRRLDPEHDRHRHQRRSGQPAAVGLRDRVRRQRPQRRQHRRQQRRRRRLRHRRAGAHRLRLQRHRRDEAARQRAHRALLRQGAEPLVLRRLLGRRPRGDDGLAALRQRVRRRRRRRSRLRPAQGLGRRGLEHAAVRQRGESPGPLRDDRPRRRRHAAPQRGDPARAVDGAADRHPQPVRRGRRPGRRHGQQDLLVRRHAAHLRHGGRADGLPAAGAGDGAEEHRRRPEEHGGHAPLQRLAVGSGHGPARLARLGHRQLQHHRHQHGDQRDARRRRRPAGLHEPAHARPGDGQLAGPVRAQLQLRHRLLEADGDERELPGGAARLHGHALDRPLGVQGQGRQDDPVPRPWRPGVLVQLHRRLDRLAHRSRRPTGR